MFNPAMQSVRGFSDGSALTRVQKLIGGGRTSIGSLSESVRVFDPAMLESIIEGLIADLPQQSIGAGPRRQIPDSIPLEIAEKIVAADGSSFRALPQIVNAIGANHDGKWKLHLQFRVLKGTTGKAVITPDETGGADDERSLLGEHIEPDLIYLANRGFKRYSQLALIVRRGSHYVIRCQMRPVEVIEDRPLSDVGREARVISDQIVRLGQSRSDVGAVEALVRMIVIESRGQTTQTKLVGRGSDRAADQSARCAHRASRFTLRRSLTRQPIRCSPILSPRHFIPLRPHIWIAIHIPHKLRERDCLALPRSRSDNSNCNELGQAFPGRSDSFPLTQASDEQSELTERAAGNVEQPKVRSAKSFVPRPISSIRLDGIQRPVSSNGEPFQVPDTQRAQSAPTKAIRPHAVKEHFTASPWHRAHPPRNTVVFRHQPLYFEDPNLERCGESSGWLTEAVNIAHFAGRIPLTGYMMGSNPPSSCVRALPDCPTCQRFGTEAYLPRPTARVLLTQTAATTGTIFLIP